MAAKQKIRTEEWLTLVKAVDKTPRPIRTTDKLEIHCHECDTPSEARAGNIDTNLKKKGYGYTCKACNNKHLSAVASKRTGNNNPFFGKKHKQSTKDKISDHKKELIKTIPKEDIDARCAKMRKAALTKYNGNPMKDESVKAKQKAATNTNRFRKKCSERNKVTWKTMSLESREDTVRLMWDGRDVWRENNPAQFTSRGELEVKTWVESLGLETKKIRPGGQELDIYIPELKIGIEYNGLYWHSEAAGKSKSYHLDKTNYFKEMGIQVIHIFEHEWNKRNQQTKSFLLSKLNRNVRRIGARKVKFKWVPPSEVFEFVETYHIQGYPQNTKSAIAGYIDEELVLVSTFAKHHRNNKDWTLNRFVCKEEWTVQGGLSKVSKMAAREYGKIISWCDLRWSDGSGYQNAGWVVDGVLKPDYFYTNGRSVVSKQSRKKGIVGTPVEVTEHEHALLDGLYRVYDCGKIRFTIHES